MGLLDGKIALITGAGQGLGRAIAEVFASEGAALMLSGRTEPKVIAVADALRTTGARVEAMRTDVADPAQVAANVAMCVERLGGLDILINNAQSVYTNIPMLEMSDAQFVEMFDTGPLATFRYMKAAQPHLKARGGGAIVNFATAAAKRWDMQGYGPYAGVKQAIRSLTRAAADEWGADNIRVNTIAPLATSPAFDEWSAAQPEQAEDLIRQIPLRRFGDPVEDIARAVLFLVSADSRYVSGATLPLDGGMANFD
ncbi:SDR family NAD(P)-dependent oxidoreductase [Sphingomonas jatrophae]|uniref:NAD(P)-dependent dehydrogenase, short-chain alcohol dehydrogenase family n=1 Tax=Sphingomonas jatrophae TaxID=1166337 RepID=A0A1I6KFQ7_9SPHN|nr:SDR family oxidoreductase [Sphingomonas jatrophae]SFR90072.1 NAD(P)-dependent dehydrogenase, short-chain alcohol dehydrogenase family [Sphingomonas jatrophae]